MPRRLKVAAAVLFLAGGILAISLPKPAVQADSPPAKAKHETYTETVKPKEADDEPVKFDMVAIPGGTFDMGSPNAEKGHNPDESPVHAVTIRPFWMGKCEVTWDEFNMFLQEVGVEDREENNRRLKADADALTGPTPTYVDKYYDHGRSGFPALCMSQHCAMEYCRWLSKKTGKIYRLPTEAEWEYAARAGTKTAYFFGDDPAKLGDYAWYADNSQDQNHAIGTTHKVGTKKPNPWGLYDMYGNVMEWCLDHYDKDWYKKTSAQNPALWPVNPPTDRRFSHVTRGGSWRDKPPELRSAARRGSDRSWLKHDPQIPQSIWWLTKMDVVGFRVARPVEEQENLKGIRSKVTLDSDY
jgi:formylglycine-generating enzyme required for sulfatase activity